MVADNANGIRGGEKGAADWPFSQTETLHSTRYTLPTRRTLGSGTHFSQTEHYTPLYVHNAHTGYAHNTHQTLMVHFSQTETLH